MGKRLQRITGHGTFSRWPLALCALLLWVQPAAAAVPGTLLVEGTLATIAGGPVADGVYSIKFSLYADAQAVSPIWQEGPVTVPVKGGGFSQLLGVTTALTPALLATASLPMLALAVGSDPELPRKPLASVPFALRAAVAEGLECQGCVTTAALSQSVFDAINAASNLATVASTGKYGDLLDKPTLIGTAQYCPTGKVVSGIDATGAVVCAASAAMGNDPLGYVSNGALANIYAVTSNGLSNLNIFDNNLTPPALDSINITNAAAIGTIVVALSVTNSDISKLTVNLIAPNGSVIVLFDKNGFKGGNIVTSYPDQTPVVAGDLAGWSGKSAKGIWQLQVIDSGAQVGGGTYDGKVNSWSIALGYPSSNKIEVKGDLTVDGNLTVNGTNNLIPPGAVLGFNTTSCPVGWIPANGNNGTPNMAGRMPIGVGNLPNSGSVALGGTGGNNRWRITSGSGQVKASCGTNCNTYNFLTAVGFEFQGLGSQVTDINTPNTGAGYIDVMPPYVGIFYCVKQ